ncbi:MAG: protein kinase domain-containing protein [Ardenticatenaceae bacterium]
MKHIGRYQITGELGKGGMAIVYRAYDPQFERQVAVKVIAAHFLHDYESRMRFEREAKVIASLAHPAIVPVHDFGEENGQPYLVMSLMEGGSLRDHLRQGFFSLDKAAEFLLRIAPALDLAHQGGVVHRDLKPDNILFDLQNNPYITDFGIAKLFHSTTELSQSGVVMGTAAYMSPEQASGLHIDERSDIYSLGVILFEMLAGRRPFESNNSVGFAYQHMHDPIPSICTINTDLPLACEGVIARAMAKNPEHRYASASDMAAALKAVLVGLPPEATSKRLPKTTQLNNSDSTRVLRTLLTRPLWQQRVVVVSTITLLIALCGAIIFMTTSESGGEPEPEPVPSSIEFEYRVMNVQDGDVLNVRSKPGIESLLVATIPAFAQDIDITGERVQVDGQVWVPIQYGELSGWVNHQFLVEESLLYRIVNVATDDTLNVRSAPKADASIVGEIPFNGTDIQITAPNVEVEGVIWVPIQHAQINGWVNRYFLIEQSLLYRVVNVEDDDTLNVRSGAGVDNSRVGTIRHNGTDVQITGTGVEVNGDFWVPIKYGQLNGWVNRSFLSEQ